MSRKRKTRPRRKSSDTTFTQFSDDGRVIGIHDIEDNPVERIQSVRDSNTQEESLLTQFEEAGKELENPWDKFIEGPMPEPKDAEVQHLERNGFGAIVFATQAVHKAKNQFKLMLEKQQFKKNITLVCRQRRSSGILPGCEQQKGLAYWMYATLSKCFHNWSETTRLNRWSKQSLDPYSIHEEGSSFLNLQVDVKINVDNDKESNPGNDEEEKNNVKKQHTITLMTPDVNSVRERSTFSNNYTGKPTNKNKTASNKSNTKTKKDISIFDYTFENSVSFVDRLTNARRDSIKLGAFNGGTTSSTANTTTSNSTTSSGGFSGGFSTIRSDFGSINSRSTGTKNNTEDPRDALVARMSPKVLLSLHINYYRLKKRENATKERRKTEDREQAIAHSIDNGGIGPSVKKLKPTPKLSFEEQKKMFLDFVEASGCMPRPPSKLKSAMHAVRSVVRMRKKLGGAFGGQFGAVTSKLKAKKALNESNLETSRSTNGASGAVSVIDGTTSPKLKSKRRMRRGSLQVGTSGKHQNISNQSPRRHSTLGLKEVATNTSVVVPRQRSMNNNGRTLVVQLNNATKITESKNKSNSPGSSEKITSDSTFLFRKNSISSISLSVSTGRGGRRIQLPTFRVVLVDDSKPFRIKLRTLLQRMFQNIVIELCATPKEGIKKVLGADPNKPINMVIVDQVFIGTKTTGKQMCDILARGSGGGGGGGGGSSGKRGSGSGSGSGSQCMSPCILVSDYIELDSGNNVDEVHARDNQDIQERRRVGRSSINVHASSSSASTNPHNNIVERCNKREINTGRFFSMLLFVIFFVSLFFFLLTFFHSFFLSISIDMVMNWFMKYVNKAPSHVFSEGTNVKQHYVNATRPSPPNQSVVRKNSG